MPRLRQGIQGAIQPGPAHRSRASQEGTRLLPEVRRQTDVLLPEVEASGRGTRRRAAQLPVHDVRADIRDEAHAHHTQEEGTSQRLQVRMPMLRPEVLHPFRFKQSHADSHRREELQM